MTVLVGANKIHDQSNIIVKGMNNYYYKNSYSWGERVPVAIKALIVGEINKLLL